MVKNEKNILIVLAIISIVLFGFIVGSANLENILTEPNISAEDFLNNQPHEEIELLGNKVIFTQPSSSAMVYSLGILTTLIGVFFIVKSNKQMSRKLWGISLVFWGLAAVSAGLSYQSFGYELKAKGRDIVLFTSLPEIIYMLLQAYSTGFMVAACGYYASNKKAVRTNTNIYSAVIVVFYFVIMLIGVSINNTFLISYTGFIVFCGYNYLVMAIFSIVYYYKNKDKLNKYMIILWISFLLVNVGYFVHLFVGNSVEAWQNGSVWFTENDTLHVLLIAWMLQILFMLYRPLQDKQLNVNNN